MKNRRWMGCVLLLLCICILLIPERGLAAAGMQKAGRIDRPGNTGKALPEAAVRKSRAGRSPVSGFSYGSQLVQGTETVIYNALKNVKDMRLYNENNPLIINLPAQYTFPKMTPNFQNTPAWKKLYRELKRAMDAYYMDYCEDYWVGGFSFYFDRDCWKEGKITRVGLGPIDYYSAVRSELGMTDTEMQKAINAVGGNSRYEVAKNAHDYILNLMSYPAANINYGPYHVINGGLLSKYRNQGVCDCYARLFYLLCRAKGVPCILVAGGSERDSGGNVIDDHIWNYVQMEDGQWYLVDCTWDDNIVEGKLNYSPYTYFLAGAGSPGVFRATVGEEHLAVGRLSAGIGYDLFVQPALAEKAYVYNGASAVQASGISLSTGKVSLKCGQMTELKVSVKPLGASLYNLKWTSSNANVAKISTMAGHPVIRAVNAGTAVITASTGSGAAACRVTISHMPGGWKVIKKATGSAEGKKEQKCSGCQKVIASQRIPKTYVKLNAAKIPLQVKKSTAALKIAASTSGDRVASWKSSNSRVVSVSSTGKLKAKKKGTATITVTMASGASAKCRVTVQSGKVKTKTLKLSKKEITLKKGQKYTIGKQRTPITAVDKITYKSSNKKVATVNSKGTILARKAGKVKITVKSGSRKATLRVTVK